jgi:anti-sigma factor RsiW
VSEHLHELLSAYLDGEVTADEHALVDAHLAICEACGLELAAADGSRLLLRSLPAVEPAAGFLGGLTVPAPAPMGFGRRAQRDRRFGLVNLVAAAAVWIAIIGFARIDRSGSSVADANPFVAAHQSVVPSFLAGNRQPAAPAEATKRHVPEVLAGRFEFVGYVRDFGRPQAIYSDGVHVMSVFSEPGRLNVSALPPSATRVLVNGVPAWQVVEDGVQVVFIPRQADVVVVVGETDDMMSGAASAQEFATNNSWTDRVEAAARGLLDTFSLRG